jgi:hypothetical protein
MDLVIANAKLRRFAKDVTGKKVTLRAGTPTSGWYGRQEKDEEVDALAFQFETGEVYLYECGRRWTSGRARAKAFFVPTEGDVDGRQPCYSARDALNQALGGQRSEYLGGVTLKVRVRPNSPGTELVAAFDVTRPDAGDWEERYTHWSTGRKDAVAMARSFLYGEMPGFALLDWLGENAPAYAREKFERAAGRALVPASSNGGDCREAAGGGS